MTALVTQSELEGLEKRLAAALRSGHAADLEVIGYGEVSLALRLSTPRGELACKRLVPFRSVEEAERAVSAIAQYVEALRACGLDVVETQTPILSGPDGFIVYCVQPMLPPGSLGPDFLRALPVDEALVQVQRIFELIGRSVTARLAPDGQLSNWAFDRGRLLYLDVGTPFLRDAEGRQLFDFRTQTRALPRPLPGIVNRFLLKAILDNYHSTRGQALDFIGNLNKEGLLALIAGSIELANRQFELNPPITEAELRSHYRSDARTYALIQSARRADRWLHRYVLRKPYPYLLPPRIERFGG